MQIIINALRKVADEYTPILLGLGLKDAKELVDENIEYQAPESHPDN